MKCYGDGFHVYNSVGLPNKPIIFSTISEARNKYAEFVAECKKYGQIPAPMYIFFGDPDVEEIDGMFFYPDYPDRIIEAGPKGGVYVKKA